MRTRATASVLLLLAACGGGGDGGDGPDGGAGPDAHGGGDGGTTPCGAFAPIQPQQLDGLELWYDAAQGQNGATWADASGNGHDVTCVGPALGTGQLSGQPAATFGGETYCAAVDGPGFAAGEGLLIAGVASFTQGGVLLGLTDENNQSSVQINAGSYAAGYIGNNAVQVGGVRYDDDRPHLFLLGRQGGYDFLRVDCDLEMRIGPLVADGPVGGYHIYVGGARPKAQMGEIVLYRGELTDAQIGGIESYLLAKYLP